MVRQLKRLTTGVAAAGPQAIAPAVYARHDGRRWLRALARETGMEGVACVDDAARTACLFLNGWEQHRLAPARDLAVGYLQFLVYMQEPDGTFCNFILDWRGAKNLSGDTSAPRPSPWSTRGLMALARAASVLGGADLRRRALLALDAAGAPTRFMDLRALHVMAGLELMPRSRPRAWRSRLEAWAEEIVACRTPAGVLLNHADETTPHLWGHVQAGALALAGSALERPDWVAAGARHAGVLLAPLARRAFPGPRIMPYDVSSAIFTLDALWRVTQNAEWRDLRDLGHAWFHGRNAAGSVIYDARRGLVYDGVDDGRVSRNSGAESNIEAGLALMESLPWSRYWSPARPASVPATLKLQSQLA